jgi:hypothetical protein
MSKISPKRFATLSHKLTVLSTLILETLDEINPNTADYLEFKSTCKDMTKFTEAIAGSVFEVDEIKSGTYIQELSTKVDTCIRKNSTFIYQES